MKKNLIFLLIILTGFFLRFFLLDSNPPRLTHDEMSIGYNSYSILKTGRDEWGRFFPLTFEAFGDHKLPGYIYTAIPFIKIFDLNVVSLKLPSVLAGLIIVIGAYYIGRNVFEDEKIGLLFAFLLAINPWPIHLSRMGLESNLALAIFTWAIYFLLSSSFQKTNKKKIFLSIFSGLLLGLTGYFYVAYRLISVLVILAYLALSLFHKANISNLKWIIASFVLTLLPLSSIIFGQSGTARFNQISIFSNSGIEMRIQEEHNFCFITNPHILPRICQVVYNKPFLYVQSFTENYLTILSPKFLFLEGDKLEYLSNPFYGEFYLFLSIFYLVGIFHVFRKNDFVNNLIKITFLITPIPSPLSGEPQIVRASALLIFVGFFCTQGLIVGYNYFLKKTQNFKHGGLVYWSIFLLFSTYFTTSYFISYNTIYAGKFETAFYPLPNEAIYLINERQSDYDLIYIDKNFPDAHIMLAFYQKIDPSWYQENVIRPTSPDGFGFSHPTKMGKYEFGDLNLDYFVCNENYPRVLYVTRNLKQTPQWVFKDYSGVHDQAEIYDTGVIKDLLHQSNSYAVACPESNRLELE